LNYKRKEYFITLHIKGYFFYFKILRCGKILIAKLALYTEGYLSAFEKANGLFQA